MRLLTTKVMNKKLPKFFRIFSLIIATTFSTASFAQQIPCPPNIDYEFGSLLLWECEIGQSVTGGTQANFTGATTVLPMANRHVITSGTATDQYGGFPQVCPGGGNYSLKLVKNSARGAAERVKYYLEVPAGINN